MDGVLYDSMRNHAAAWVQSMQKFGINMTADDAYATEGARGVDTIRYMVRAAGISIGVVTGSGQRPLIARILRDFGRFVSPEHITTAYDVPRGKPHPDPYLIGMKKAGGLLPSEAIVVENAPLGVRAGIAAGCYTIAVNTGPLPDQVLLDAGASILFPSMPALSDAWKEVISKIH